MTDPASIRFTWNDVYAVRWHADKESVSTAWTDAEAQREYVVHVRGLAERIRALVIEPEPAPVYAE